jgi:hypothetical protein
MYHLIFLALGLMDRYIRKYDSLWSRLLIVEFIENEKVASF